LPYENKESNTEILRKIQRDIEEIKSTLRLFLLQSRKDITEEINKELSNPQKKIVYDLTDGNHSAYEIAQIVKVSLTSIHRWWRDWERSGIVSRTERKGKSIVQKRFSLEDMGIEVPSVSEIQGTKNEIGEIPSKEKLKSILRDSSMFSNNVDLSEFAEKVFYVKVPVSDREDLIERIVNLFFNSPKIKQMMFMQAMKQKAQFTGSSFKDYFEFWEKNIKSEI
jgi:hypothetical protein